MSSQGDTTQFNTLVDIIARLRAPDGCPWDRQQTHASLRVSMLEECYEVLAALDSGGSAELCDELGDLIMQVIFHAQIAAEAGEFELADVLRNINIKLVNRHPHIFASTSVQDAEEVAHNWEAIKKGERGQDASMLDSVPAHMPALAYSQSIQRRVAEAGFDWKDIDGVIEKLVEEVGEFKQAVDDERRAQEYGDLLFTLVNFARRLGIDSEAALREANQRFFRRFSYMETICRQRGLNFNDLSFEEQNNLWQEAKRGAEG
ncbi:nucleoside triphosphate pyrophosphohydrolase [Chloroflexota bacterium]